MKTVLFAALTLLMAPFASFSGDVPASVMTQIEESCNESVASDDQATNSEESESRPKRRRRKRGTEFTLDD